MPSTNAVVRREPLLLTPITSSVVSSTFPFMRPYRLLLATNGGNCCRTNNHHLCNPCATTVPHLCNNGDFKQCQRILLSPL